LPRFPSILQLFPIWGYPAVSCGNAARIRAPKAGSRMSPVHKLSSVYDLRCRSNLIQPRYTLFMLWMVATAGINRVAVYSFAMRCIYCNSEISTLNPFAFCPTCGQALDGAQTAHRIAGGPRARSPGPGSRGERRRSSPRSPMPPRHPGCRPWPRPCAKCGRPG